MKIMHKPLTAARAKIEECLEKNGKELVDLAYASANENDKRFLIGIACKRCYNKEITPNRYDVIFYDIDTDRMAYASNNLNYENSLIEMGQRIRRRTYKNQ